MTTPTPEPLPNDVNARLLPTQVDRDAAADLIERFWNIESGPNRNVMRDVAADMRAGLCGGLWEEAFARHRLAHATPPPEAKGWKLLPVVPTEEMITKALVETRHNSGVYLMIAVYKAMLAAAPLPASPVGDDEGGGR